MKYTIKLLVGIVIFFVAVMTAFNLAYKETVENRHKERNVIINRLYSEITAAAKTDGFDYDDLFSYIPDDEKNRLVKNYGKECLPDTVAFIPLENVADIPEATGSDRVYYAYMYDKNNELIGLVRYAYNDNATAYSRIMVNIVIIFCFASAAAFILYVNNSVLKPFVTFTEYPEHIAKGRTDIKLPETKNRYLGRFIWGMNMLTDVLDNNQKRLSKLEAERQTLLTSIAHGVKTPVTNIKLYASAIETGLYNENGKPDSSSADVAVKIEKNAVDIEKMISEMLETSSTAVCDFEPQIVEFYLKELAELVEKEYTDRLKMCRLPYKIECVGNPLMSSDKWGLFRIISQLLENAVKYGNGEGITVSMWKQDDGFFISVKNRGSLLPQSELPFVFKSYWRGSNSQNVDGSGIGLFTAREIALKLGGNIYVNRCEDTEEMEFLIYIG